MAKNVNRRNFMSIAAVSGMALAPIKAHVASDKPALLGGKRIRNKPFPSWPVVAETDEKAVAAVVRSARWGRFPGGNVDRFEEKFRDLIGAKYCVATNSGTSGLITSLGALGIGAGDEVIVAPYTWIASVNCVLIYGAMPVFVDTDVETFQIDARKIEAAITDRTVAILPVHIGGNSCDMDTIMAIADKHKLPVVEDACQSHLSEWRGRKVGTFGATGVFSFQSSKNLTSGEGGALLTADAELDDRCWSFHTNGRRKTSTAPDFTYDTRGANLRMTEFQAALLMVQMTRLEDQTKIREQNAHYLTSLLREIPGIVPARMYEGCTRNGYHLYGFRYRKEQFAHLPRDKFLKALAAEGIGASSGYPPLNKDKFLADTFSTRGFQHTYGKRTLAEWHERNQCPQNDKLCEEAVWLYQTRLLGERADMDQIAEAIRRIQKYAGELARV